MRADGAWRGYGICGCAACAARGRWLDMGDVADKHVIHCVRCMGVVTPHVDRGASAWAV